MSILSVVLSLFINSHAEAQKADAAFVCNGMDSREVLQKLKQEGADLSEQREAIFFFYGAEEKLVLLQKELEKLGFSVEPSQTDPGRIATMNAVTDNNWLRIMMPKLCDLSAKFDVRYDGWEASL